MIKRKGHILASTLALLLTIALTGCDTRTGNNAHDHDHHGHDHNGHAHEHAQPTESAERLVRVARAELQPTENYEARGTVTFTRTEEGVSVAVAMEGVPGPGNRGFHIHEHGDCSAPDATSAGGHFNPADMPHGAPHEPKRHAGDFGNIEVDENGVAKTEFIDTHISFDGPHSILGKAVIVHAGEDDLESQPAGDAGPRAACGVIQVVEYVE